MEPGTTPADLHRIPDATRPRRPFRSPEDALGDQLATITELSDTDRAMLLSFLDALVTRTRLMRFTADIS